MGQIDTLQGMAPGTTECYAWNHTGRALNGISSKSSDRGNSWYCLLHNNEISDELIGQFQLKLAPNEEVSSDQQLFSFMLF